MAIEYRQEIEVDEPIETYKNDYYNKNWYWGIRYRTFKAIVTADSIAKIKEQIDAAWHQFDDIKEKFRAEADEKNKELQQQYDERDRIQLEQEKKKQDAYEARNKYYEKCAKEAEYAWITLSFYKKWKLSQKWRNAQEHFVYEYANEKLMAYDKEIAK